MKELLKEEVNLVVGGAADFSGVTATVTSTAKIITPCTPQPASARTMPYFSFACTTGR